MTHSAVTTILFDLDNTLSYYPLSTRQVIDEMLKRAGLSETVIDSAEWAAQVYDSLWVETERASPSLFETRRRLWLRILEEAGRPNPELATRMAQLCHAIRRESGVCLFPWAAQLLADLKAHYRLGLLTNGSSEMQWEKIERMGIRNAFDSILVAGDIGIYKPDVEVFRLLLVRLGEDAEHALFVGDSYDMDIVGAHGAGLATAWIRPDGAVPGAVVPDYSVATARDLREVLL
jgi:HAD superfamily hydrolase (TIGR01509 family)